VTEDVAIGSEEGRKGCRMIYRLSKRGGKTSWLEKVGGGIGYVYRVNLAPTLQKRKTTISHGGKSTTTEKRSNNSVAMFVLGDKPGVMGCLLTGGGKRDKHGMQEDRGS